MYRYFEVQISLCFDKNFYFIMKETVTPECDVRPNIMFLI
jgi:hypothetical protein